MVILRRVPSPHPSTRQSSIRYLIKFERSVLYLQNGELLSEKLLLDLLLETDFFKILNRRGKMRKDSERNSE